MQHSFDGEKHTSGIVSQISFENKDFMAGLRLMFDAKEDEIIVAFEVTSEGIKTYFEKRYNGTLFTKGS